MTTSDEKELEKVATKIIKALVAHGYKAYFAGGFVRNRILKKSIDNVDIATDALPDEVEKILKSLSMSSKPVGKEFGTILAISRHGKVEITTFRKEGFYKDKRHPSFVKFTNKIEEDALRRDFTINALYFDPVSGEMKDFVGGLKDLKAGLIRFVGDPKDRIDEDSLRMLRAVRIATQLNFKLEKTAFAAVKTRAKFIQYVSGERIKAELDKILLLPNRAEGLRLLDEVCLLKFIIPEIEAIKTFSHKSKVYHLEGSIFDHTLLALSKVKEDNLDLIYALLFHDIGKPQTGKKVLKLEGWVISTKGHADVSADIFFKFATKLAFSSRERKAIDWLIRKHMLMVNFYEMKSIKQLTLVEYPAFNFLLRHWYYDEAATIRKSHMDEYHKKFLKSLNAGLRLKSNLIKKNSLIKKLTRGDLVMKYSGLKPSPALGHMIKNVKAQIILDKIKNEKDLEIFLKKG